MKLIFIIIIFIPFFCNSQSDSTFGIGMLRLGKSYDSVISDLKLRGKKIVEKKRLAKVNYPKSYYKIYYDTSEFYSSVRCPNSLILHIPNYAVAGIKIEDVELKFYNDILYELTIKEFTGTLYNVLDQKYGEHTVSKSTMTNYCRLATGDKIPFEDAFYLNSWKTQNSSYSISEIIYESRDETTCKIETIAALSYTNKSLEGQVNGCEKLMEQAEKGRKMKQNSTILKNF